MEYYIAFQIALLLLALAAIVSIFKPWDIENNAVVLEQIDVAIRIPNQQKIALDIIGKGGYFIVCETLVFAEFFHVAVIHHYPEKSLG